jgi:hypothetical protein
MLVQPSHSSEDTGYFEHVRNAAVSRGTGKEWQNALAVFGHYHEFRGPSLQIFCPKQVLEGRFVPVLARPAQGAGGSNAQFSTGKNLLSHRHLYQHFTSWWHM